MSSKIMEENSHPENSASLVDSKNDHENSTIQEIFPPEETVEMESSFTEEKNDDTAKSSEEADDEHTERNHLDEVNHPDISQEEIINDKSSINQTAPNEDQSSEQCIGENLTDDVGSSGISQKRTEIMPENQTLGSLGDIKKYNSDISDSESEDSEKDSESDSDEDSTSEDDSGSDSDQDSNNAVYEDNIKKPREESWMSVLGVNMSTELPDISTLSLSDKEEFIHMGNLQNVIDIIVLVAGIPNSPAYDLDTLLFLEEGQKVLGYVIDVMGPISEPVYILQMDSVKIKQLELNTGMKVYCAPRSQYTKYVLLQEVMRMRGSDASGVGDNELPEELQDYSDDEQERLSKAPKKGVKRKMDPVTTDRLPQGGMSQHSTSTQGRNRNQEGRIGGFNKRNNPPGFANRPPRAQNLSVLNPVSVARNSFVPAFNPSVPPPSHRLPTFYPTRGPTYLPPRPSYPPPMPSHPPFNEYVPPGNFPPPRGAQFNNGPFYGQNMPGPSNGNWFNE